MKLKIEKKILNLRQTFLHIFIFSLILSLMQTFMHIGISGITSFLDAFNPIILIINSSLFFIVISFLVFLTGKFHISFIIMSVITQLFLIVNHYKIHFLSVPLKASDLILGKEATGMLGNYTIPISIKVVLITLCLILLCVFAFKYLKNEKIKITYRLLGIIITLLVSYFSYNYFYLNTKIYDSVTFFSNEFSEVDVVNGHGFFYSMVNGIGRTKYQKPDGYDKENVKALLDVKKTDESYPNVIAVMSEAFFDIREAKNIKFNKNPLPTYTKLKKEGIYGDIIVPGFAGNTSSAEFEFLTGVNISLIDKGMPVPYKTFLTKKAYSLVRHFKDEGFDTVAMHPGFKWFYNRGVAYNALGFNRTIFIEDLDYKPSMTNYYANDSEAAKMIINDYSKHLETNYDKGYFNFTVTIQNHGPYMTYDTEKEDITKRIDSMTDSEYYTVDNYVQGLKDADDFLKTIKEYIDSIDKPTVVVFFGDHLPYMDSQLKIYDLIGYDITSGTESAVYRKYKTPYLIFSNSAFKKDMLEKGKSVLRGKRQTISSSYLATELLRYMNVKMPPYYEYIYNLKQDINVFSPHFYMKKNKFSYELSDSESEKVKVLKDLQYYNMMEYGK